MTFSTCLLLLVGGVGALMPARMGRPCATAAHVRAPACGMVASWCDTGKRLTAGGYGYDPEVKFWPSVGGTTGYHRMNGALPATAQFRLGKQSPGDLPPAEQPMAGDAAEPQATKIGVPSAPCRPARLQRRNRGQICWTSGMHQQWK